MYRQTKPGLSSKRRTLVLTSSSSNHRRRHSRHVSLAAFSFSPYDSIKKGGLYIQFFIAGFSLFLSTPLIAISISSPSSRNLRSYSANKTTVSYSVNKPIRLPLFVFHYAIITLETKNSTPLFTLPGFITKMKILVLLSGPFVHLDMSRPQFEGEDDGLQTWKVAANILNKQSRTADKRWAYSLRI